MNEQPTHIDLFSGIGGFAIAAQAAGFRTVAFCEIEPFCKALIQERFGAVMADAKHDGRNSRPHKERTREVGNAAKASLGAEPKHRQAIGFSPIIHGDIRTLDGRLYRGAALLTGGFPCQPFSVAGKRRGAADDRFLWPEMLRVVSEARPAWIVGENVPGIIPMELDRVLSDLENLGYACWPLVIPACAVDARHRRDRVWIVANCAGSRQQAFNVHAMGAGRKGLQLATVSSHPPLANRINPRLEVQQCEPRHDGSEQPATERDGNGRQGRKFESGLGLLVDGVSRWLDEPADLPRVIKGTPNRVQRLKGLGNAIVPAVAYELLRSIRELI